MTTVTGGYSPDPRLMELPPLMTVKATRIAAGGRGQAWIYTRINNGDFESILDGSRRLIVTASFLTWLDTKRAESQIERMCGDEVSRR